jgi:hypothetical protein
MTWIIRIGILIWCSLMRGAFAFVLLAGLVYVGCSSGEAETKPLSDCSAALPAGSQATTSAAVPGAATCVEPGQPPVSIALADAELGVSGTVAIGPAVRLVSTGETAHGVDVTLPYEEAKVPKGRHDEILVLLRRGHAPAHAALVVNVRADVGRGRLHLHVPEGWSGAYGGAIELQPALRSDAATGGARTRRFTYRAIAGVSMGGFGASVNGWGDPSRWDAIGVMGADPGPDMTYSLGMIYDGVVGGFCTAPDDGADKIGQLCPSRRQMLVKQLERPFSFEKLLYEKGEGTGLTLRRDLYMRATRDLSRAMGNLAYHNPRSTYLPPGVPSSWLALPPAERCANPVKLKKFFDRRYNPTGAFDVITFCDGNDSDRLGNGVFDPTIAPTNPPEVLLAVDVNSNGKRDSGEPVVVQAFEPWSDVGVDGKASKDEPGYDALANPDPAGDDFHYLWNPTGTEGNWRYDAGEPYEDVGLDGVPASTGGCPSASGMPDCWDYGEGNGRYDYAPTVENWRALDPRGAVERATDEELARLDVYYDVGIRDFFNAQVSTNALLGVLAARNHPVRAWEGFPSLVGEAPSRGLAYDYRKVAADVLSRYMYVRYGDPDLSEALVEQTGDGRHAGGAQQAIHRAQTMFRWIGSRWPDGDRALEKLDYEGSLFNKTFTTSTGREVHYTVLVPPGYMEPKNASKRYPVVYVGHGYGMDPEALGPVGYIAQTMMVDDKTPEERRLAKFIFVAIDARCRPGGDVRNGPLSTDGDLCEEGAFYVDHPDGVYKGSKMLDELEAVISAEYRTRAPEDRAVTD